MSNNKFPGYQRCQLVKRRKTNVSRAISVLVVRVLTHLENQSVSDIGLAEFSRHISTLKTRTEMVLATLVFRLFTN
jgi:hypothetical protein